jgi:uncharacterized protein with HEPN domain
MAKTAKLRLLDALEAIASINSFIGSLPLEDFLANAMVQAAIGMRNRIVHAYDQIDFEILWDAIHSDLSDLKIRLESYLAEGENV